MTMPQIQILIALRAAIAAELEPRRLRGKEITARHGRHRESRDEEWPCVEVIYVSHDPSEQYGRQETGGGDPEEVWELQVDLGVVLQLFPEPRDQNSDDGDPTGVGDHGQIMQWILDMLFPDLVAGAEPNTLDGKVWQMRYDGASPDEADLNPDYARLAERLTLFYRVRADRPTVLLES